MISTTYYRFLFFVEQNYCFDILCPLQELLIESGHEIRRLLAGKRISRNFLKAGEQQLEIDAAVKWQPHAVFVLGDRVPGLIPRLKIAVFHGLNEDKRGGEYLDRGMFDLYCTEGPGCGISSKKLAKKLEYFSVKETGSLKLDALFIYTENSGLQSHERPQILLASTFTPSLSCAEDVFEQVENLSKVSRWQRLITGIGGIKHILPPSRHTQKLLY